MKRLNAVGAIASAIAMVAGVAQAFDADTVAFYDFKDGAPGESAKDVTIKNAVDANVCPGGVTLSGNGVATFSADNPGAYMFEGCGYLTNDAAVCTNIQSIYVNRGATTSHKAQLSFEGLSSLARANGANPREGYTVEFFYKYDTNALTTATLDNTIFKFFTGLKDAVAENADHTNLTSNIAFTHTTDGKIRFRNQSYWRDATAQVDRKFINYSSSPVDVRDGLWHHMAIRYPVTVKTGGKNWECIAFQNDRVSTVGMFVNVVASNGSETNLVFDANLPIQDFIFNSAFKGWISGLRVSKCARTDAESLYPSTLQTCLPRTVSRLRLDGTGTLSDGDVLSSSESYEALNPQLYFLPDAAGTEIRGTDGCVVCPAGASAAYTDAVKKPFVFEEKSLPKRDPNEGSVEFAPVASADPDVWAQGAGIQFSASDFALLPYEEPKTLEFFYRFDKSLWESRVAGTNKWIMLAWLSRSDEQSDNWRIYMDLNDAAHPKLCLGDGTWQVGLGTWEDRRVGDGLWHHVAIVMDAEGVWTSDRYYDAYAYVYFDYQEEPVFSRKGRGYSGGERTLYLARQHGAGNRKSHAFAGDIDEVRLSRGWLKPEDFLRQKNFGGMMLLFR